MRPSSPLPLLLAFALTACGGDGSVRPDGPASAAPPASGSASTADEAAAIAAVPDDLGAPLEPSEEGEGGIRRVGEVPGEVAAPSPVDGVGPATSGRSTALPAPVQIPADPPRFERPEHVRGVYLNAWTAGSRKRIEELIELARRTEVNAFVIDLKDASGYVSYSTGVPLAREIGATEQLRIRDLNGLLRRLEEEGIYPIARIVIVQDPVLVAARPDLSVQDEGGGVWVDGKGIRWLNLYLPEVRDYHVALAREAAELGFPEIQWDYVRFPDAPRSELARAVFPGSGGRTRNGAVRDFLSHGREELSVLGVVVTADVFGVTTSAGDVGIGQVWEEFIDVVDVALPMVYPSHYYRGSFGFERPNGYPYEVVKHALEHGLRRSRAVPGAGALRPWLQDFSLGQPPYAAPEVRAQIQATYDAGIQEWVLWNPSSRYTRDALKPAEGFSDPPLMRIAGQVVPATRRFEVLRSAYPPAKEPGQAGDTLVGGRE